MTDPLPPKALPGLAIMPAVSLVAKFSKTGCALGIEYRGFRFFRAFNRTEETRDFVARNFPEFLQTFQEAWELTKQEDAKREHRLQVACTGQSDCECTSCYQRDRFGESLDGH